MKSRMKRIVILLAVLVLGSVCRAEGESWKIDAYHTFMKGTHQFSTGNAYAATGDVHLNIYEDVGVTDDASGHLVRNTDMAQFDGLTGVYAVKVQLTAAVGFEAGKHYHAIITATVDGVTANTIEAFQILAPVDVNSVSHDGLAALATDWTDAGRLDAIIDSILADTGLWDTTSEARIMLVGKDVELATEPNETTIATNALAAKTAAEKLDTASELRILAFGKDVEGATEPNETLIKTETDKIANATYGLNALHTDITSIIDSLAHGTYGLDALHTDIGAVGGGTVTVSRYRSN